MCGEGSGVYTEVVRKVKGLLFYHLCFGTIAKTRKAQILTKQTNDWRSALILKIVSSYKRRAIGECLSSVGSKIFRHRRFRSSYVQIFTDKSKSSLK